MNTNIIEAVDLLATLKHDDKVKVTADGRTNDMYVSRTLHRADGAYGSYESSRVTVTFGPGRYAREVTAEQIADGRVAIERTV